MYFYCDVNLNHWGRVTHICVSELTIIGSNNGLLPERHQAIIWTNAGILLIGQTSMKFQSQFKHFHSRKCIWRCRLRNGVHLSRPQCVNWCPFELLFRSQSVHDFRNIVWKIKLTYDEHQGIAFLPAIWLFVQKTIQTNNKKAIKALHYCSFLCRESTNNWASPYTKRQWKICPWFDSIILSLHIKS